MADISNKKPWLNLIFIFLIVNIIFVLGRSFLEKFGVDFEVLRIGHILVFTVTMLSYLFHHKAITATKTNTFITHTYAGTFIKIIVILAAALIYIFYAGKAVNKPAVFICMSLYLLYSFLEVMIIAKNKKKPNV